MSTPEKIANTYKKFQDKSWKKPEHENMYIKAVLAEKYRLPEGVTLDQFRNQVGIPVEGGTFEGITGAARTTEQIAGMKDWSKMPEMSSDFKPRTGDEIENPTADQSKSMFKVLMANLATLSTDPDETVKILKSMYPDIEVKQDVNKTFMMKSGIDDEWYAMTPGMTMSDINRAIMTGLKYAPAALAGGPLAMMGTAGAIGAATQTGEKLAGGDFDVLDVAFDALAEGIVPGFGKLTAGVKNAFFKEVIKEIPDIVKIAKQAAEGSTPAQKKLAAMVEANPTIQKAMKSFGIEDLTPGQISSSETYRTLEAEIASLSSVALKDKMGQGIGKTVKALDDYMTNIKGGADFAELEAGVRGKFEAGLNFLDEKGNDLYKFVKSKIPDTADAPATSTMKFLDDEIAAVKGFDKLTPIERKIYKRLKPKKVKTGLLDSAGKPIYKLEQPSYKNLDNLRKELNHAIYKKQGEFKDGPTGLMKKYRNMLLDDQGPIAEQFGVSKEFSLARKTVGVRKRVEENMQDLFGKNLEGTIIPSMKTGVKRLSDGQVNDFVNFIKKIPRSMRQEVTAAGMRKAFMNNAKDLTLNNYATWYKGISQNPKAKNALMMNLPKEARKKLADMGVLADNLTRIAQKDLKTGKSKNIRDRLKELDTGVNKLWSFVKRVSGPLAVGGMASITGLANPFVASSLVAGMKSGSKKSSALAIDELLASPQFLKMVENTTGETARKLTQTSVWKKFVKGVGSPKELTNAEQWLMATFQATKPTADTTYEKLKSEER